MTWNEFPYIAYGCFTLWISSLVLLYLSKTMVAQRIAHGLLLVSIVFFTAYIVSFWFHIERPPLRTLGETRLWYAYFLPIVGFVTYKRWKYKWFLGYSLFLSSIFLSINLFKTETHDKTLMPALQSPWFVPHVIVYIFAYALLAAASAVGFYGLFKKCKKIDNSDVLPLGDNMVYIGFAFLTLGLVFGALWAKEAWGHYWTWDPKETWAFISWITYLIYIHFRHFHPRNSNSALWILFLSFFVLLVCWFGINYLPSASNSVHIYAR